DPIPAGSEPMVIYTINATVLEGAAETNVLDITVNEFKNYPIGGTVTLLEHYVYDGAVIIGEEPTEPPVEPTEPPVEPTEPPVEPTEPPVEPTEPPVEPTPTPAPVPGTGAATLIGLGVMALLSGAGVVLFRKKED
ncbi:MAG: NPXTG-anchored protein, partial [Clostridiales bacterium]|nr:NPXTG-anchored protein [Clostridiales bacterium]